MSDADKSSQICLDFYFNELLVLEFDPDRVKVRYQIWMDKRDREGRWHIYSSGIGVGSSIWDYDMSTVRTRWKWLT